MRRHVADLLLPGGGDEIAGEQWPLEEIALERFGRALEAHLALGGGEDHALGRARFRFPHRDMIARADFGIGPLQPVEPDDVEALVLGIGQHCPRRGAALADNLEHIALGYPQCGHGALGQTGDTLAAFFLPGRRDLQLYGFFVDSCWRVGHGADSRFASGAS